MTGLPDVEVGVMAVAMEVVVEADAEVVVMKVVLEIAEADILDTTPSSLGGKGNYKGSGSFQGDGSLLGQRAGLRGATAQEGLGGLGGRWDSRAISVGGRGASRGSSSGGAIG